MDNVSILPANSIGRNFIPKEFIPIGKDEYCHRNTQIPWPQNRWRHLRADEVELLVQNSNTSDNWDEVLVTDPFDPQESRIQLFSVLSGLDVFRM